MKKSDIAMIVLIAGTSILLSYFIAKVAFGGTYTGSAKVRTMEQISSEVEKPDPEIFNKDAINPAVKVVINTEPKTQ